MPTPDRPSEDIVQAIVDALAEDDDNEYSLRETAELILAKLTDAGMRVETEADPSEVWPWTATVQRNGHAYRGIVSDDNTGRVIASTALYAMPTVPTRFVNRYNRGNDLPGTAAESGPREPGPSRQGEGGSAPRFLPVTMNGDSRDPYPYDGWIDLNKVSALYQSASITTVVVDGQPLNLSQVDFVRITEAMNLAVTS